MKHTLYLKDRLYIPCSAISERVLRKHYRKVVYQETTCQRCPHRPDRPSEFCENCEAFKGVFKTYKEVKFQNIPFYGIPRAELYCLDKLGLNIDDFKVVDKMAKGTPLDKKLKLTKVLYPYQLQCQQELISPQDPPPYYQPHGILKAPPRSGKCVVGNTLIITESGFCRIRDLFYDNQEGVIPASIPVLSKDRLRMTAALYKQTVNQTILVTTSRGFQIQGTPNHPVMSQGQWVALDQLKIGQVLDLQSVTYHPEGSLASLTRLHELGNKVKQAIIHQDALSLGAGLPSIVLTAHAKGQLVFIEQFFKIPDQTKLVVPYSDCWLQFVRDLQLVLLNLGHLTKLKIASSHIELEIDHSLTQGTSAYSDLIESIEIINQEVTVYDLSIPHTHSFISNGLVSHNTLTALSIAIELKGKFLILANQEDLLKQFIIELNKSTNVMKTKSTYKICSTVKDFQEHDICLATYQTFLSKKGQVKLEAIKDMFTTVIVDECHRVAAKRFSSVVSRFSAKNRFGLTATDKRKDGMDFITRQILGEVRANAQIDTLVPKVYVIETNIKPVYQYRSWNGAMQFLARSSKRKKLILDYLKRDLENGHKIVVPVAYKRQAFELVKAVQSLGYTAEAFVAGVKRDELLDRARLGKIDVIVGIRSIVSTGINVPVWSCLGGNTWLPTKHGHIRMKTLDESMTNLILHNGEGPASINFCGLRKTADSKIIGTQYGHEITASLDHKFVTVTKDYQILDKTTADLKPGDRLLSRACFFYKLEGAESDNHSEARYAFYYLAGLYDMEDPEDIGLFEFQPFVAYARGLLNCRPSFLRSLDKLRNRLVFQARIEILEIVQHQIFHLFGTHGVLDRKKKRLVYQKSAQLSVFTEQLTRLNQIKPPVLDSISSGYQPVTVTSIRDGGVVDLYDVSMANPNFPYYVSGTVISHNCQYTIAPISNPPNYYQETLRVCTPMEGKKTPIIRIFVDDMPMTKGCFRTCWFHTFIKYGFVINEKHMGIAKKIINSMGRRFDEDEGDSVYRDPEKAKEKQKTKQWRPLNLFGTNK